MISSGNRGGKRGMRAGQLERSSYTTVQTMLTSCIGRAKLSGLKDRAYMYKPRGDAPAVRQPAPR